MAFTKMQKWISEMIENSSNQMYSTTEDLVDVVSDPENLPKNTLKTIKNIELYLRKNGKMIVDKLDKSSSSLIKQIKLGEFIPVEIDDVKGMLYKNKDGEVLFLHLDVIDGEIQYDKLF